MLDPQALRALAAISLTGSVAGAADELGFTASAVSQQVKRLSVQVGVPLTARVGRGVVLTPAGQALVDAAPEVFAALERASDAARRRSATVAGTLRLAAFSTAVRGLVTPRLPGLAAAFPALDLAIDELDPAEAAAALSSGAAELALVHDMDGVALPLPAGVRSRAVHTDVGDVIVRSDHPLAQRRSLTGRDLVGSTWVTSPPGTACHDWFQRLFVGAETNPRVLHRVDDFSTQLALVEAGGVTALIPRLARPALPASVRAVPVEPAPVRRVDAVWRASSESNPALLAVIDALAGESPAATGSGVEAS